MKYRRIKFTQHPILKDLELNLTDTNGHAFNNIILAGENGVGKSVLLEFLYTFNTLNMRNSDSGSVEIEIEVTNQEIDMVNSSRTSIGKKTVFPNGVENNILTIVYDHTTGVSEYPSIIYRDKDGNEINMKAISIGAIFKAIYSDVAINFNPGNITNVTALDIDTSENQKMRSSSNLATEIKQLLIDINSSDAEELQQWVDTHEGSTPPQDILHSRMKRFTKAFNTMFPIKRFVGIVNVDNQKDVKFIENGIEMSIDKLSSGEKQIVFRGSFLLRNQGKMDGYVVLIDEPEISMHPKWEREILSFFKTLFIKDDGTQKAQIFFATHSEHLVKEALENKSENVVVVISKDDQGNVTSRSIMAPDKLQDVTSAEVNYLAFGLYSTDYHIQLYGALQTKEGKSKILDCDKFISTTAAYSSDITKYSKTWIYGSNTYTTLPTYIRNSIDHPDNGHHYTYTDEELEDSTELLRNLI